jgi:MFS transporter, FSR family, fosmidomycin resistance protein
MNKIAPAILIANSLSHLLNDLLQSLLPSIYPILKTNLHLSFSEVGLITFVFQLTASILQPLVGMYTDRNPLPFSSSIGMVSSLLGLVLLSFAASLPVTLLAAALIGIGSAVFHPESSRIARNASGGRYGLAQSLFQVGGNVGTAIGPLLAALIIVPLGQASIVNFIVVPIVAIAVLFWIGLWYRSYLEYLKTQARSIKSTTLSLPKPIIVKTIIILLVLIFSKFFYTAMMSTFYTFYLIDKFHMSVPDAQISLFMYLAAIAVGTLIGGPIGDRYGRLVVIWVSILGVLPLTLIMPYSNLFWTQVLSMGIGFIIASAFSSIIVYAQDLLPGRVGMVSGLFFGFAFGMGGLGAGLLGILADKTSVDFVFKLCAFLPALGVFTYFLPKLDKNANELR